jgi:hypothetical protein
VGGQFGHGGPNDAGVGTIVQCLYHFARVTRLAQDAQDEAARVAGLDQPDHGLAEHGSDHDIVIALDPTLLDDKSVPKRLL